jgi:hypothetical protein
MKKSDNHTFAPTKPRTPESSGSPASLLSPLAVWASLQIPNLNYKKNDNHTFAPTKPRTPPSSLLSPHSKSQAYIKTSPYN